jgi:DNA repair protein RadC
MSQPERESCQISMWPVANEPGPTRRDTVEEERIIQQALGILETRCLSGEAMLNPSQVARFLRLKLGGLKNECFAALYLNGRHELLAYREHFHGTIDGASVYPRVIVQTALEVNAAAVVCRVRMRSFDRILP